MPPSPPWKWPVSGQNSQHQPNLVVMQRQVLPRPFLKWAGGKTQLVEALRQRIPRPLATYHEPFLGSGALFFHLYREGFLRQAVLSDINAELMDTYRAIRDHVEAVVALLAHYPYDRDFYYRIREQDPRSLSLPERAARMIYLNKTGYNGLYRVNRQGKFNVPFGRHKKPCYCDPENLRAVSQALQQVELYCASFETVLERAQPGDFVYFDPPYVPVSRTAHFTSYHSAGFGHQEQERLRDIVLTLTQRGVRVMLSNSDTPFVRNLYAEPVFHVDTLRAKRAINCRSTGRGDVPELLITNYPNFPPVS
ncbi:Modification methylase DpnIIA [bacterium HR36]|nr:Modification methylase DpnIIA [bacterium HR36]